MTAASVLGLALLFGIGVFAGWRLANENRRIERTFRDLITDLERPTDGDPYGPPWERYR